MSLLLAAGHPEAQLYPLGMLDDECRLVVSRNNGIEKTRVILLQQAVSALLSKKGQQSFRATLKKLKTDD